MSGGVRVEAVAGGVKVQLGEGPHWVEQEQALYFVDLLAGGLHRYDPANNSLVSTSPAGGRSLSLVVPVAGARGNHVVSIGRDLAVLQWDGLSSESRVARVLATVEEDQQSRGGTRFNDGKADPTGRLWAGTMSTEVDVGREQPNHGSLYSLENGGTRAKRWFSDVGISNGLAWTTDNFYYVDSCAEKVDVFNFDTATGSIANRRTVFDFQRHHVQGVPDGMTIDATGKLWVAVFGSGANGQVLCVDPGTGQLVTSVTIPAAQVTSVTWGGRALDQLYVTTAAVKDQAGQSEAGKLYCVTGLGARGLSASEVVLDPSLLN